MDDIEKEVGPSINALPPLLPVLGVGEGGRVSSGLDVKNSTFEMST